MPRYRDHPDLDLVAEPARDGPIMGRMDFHRPVLYIAAVSYRGLVDAARLADRLGEQEQAASWRAAARGLREAWERAFHGPQSTNPRTLATALWPTAVGAPHAAQFRRTLDRHWARSREEAGAPRDWPLWSYFEVSESHQWLLLGEPARTLAALHWFWGHQASPGLYTWWEDVGEGNAYGGWNGVRGWVRPPSSQPHYWTTAEMLLLQVDCLAHLVERDDEDIPDGAPGQTELVIGAGVPPEWLDRSVSVRGIRTRPEGSTGRGTAPAST